MCLDKPSETILKVLTLRVATCSSGHQHFMGISILWGKTLKYKSGVRLICKFRRQKALYLHPQHSETSSARPHGTSESQRKGEVDIDVSKTP